MQIRTYEFKLKMSFYSLLLGKEVLWLFFFSTFFLCLDFKFWSLLIEFHELGKIELGFLENLDFSDNNVLKWEDFSTFLCDLFPNCLRDAKDIINK
jgi:hypothetical protein